MVECRRFLRLAFVMVSVLVLGACANNETAPTPVATPAPIPTPPPSPSGSTFTLSGAVSETAPTTTPRVPEAEVQVSGGVATGSASDGTFTIPTVASGTYTLRIAKAGYETKTQTVTVAGANVTGAQMS